MEQLWIGRRVKGRWQKGKTLRGRFESQVAYSNDSSVELPLRPSARLAAPWGPRELPCRLRARTKVVGAGQVNAKSNAAGWRTSGESDLR